MNILLEAKENLALFSDRETFELRNKLLQFINQIPTVEIKDIQEDLKRHAEQEQTKQDGR